MQRDSIHNPVQTKKPFPTSGDNFTTVSTLDGVNDPMSWLTAIDFVNDCMVALAAFEEEEKRTGTP